MDAVIVIAALCIGFTLYALPAGITRVSPDDFFLMGRSAKVKQYNDATVAYSLQVAVTIYFFYWGFQYGLANLFFIATWFLGLLAFGAAASRVARLMADRQFDGSFLAVLANGSRRMRVFMALLVIVSLVGLLFTELYFTSMFVESVAKAQATAGPTPHFYFWVGFGFLAFVVLWYCSLGGMRKVVVTDTWQLSIAYVGAAVFIATLAPSINGYAGTGALRFVMLGMAFLFLAMAFLPGMVSRVVQRGRGSHANTSVTTFLALLLAAAICAVPLLTLPVLEASQAIVFPKPVTSMFDDPFGWAPIVGFTIINLIWQFSDYTAYHRLAVLDLPEDERGRIRKIRESVFVTMFNSPLTWGLGIFAGMAVAASGLVAADTTDVFNAFVSAAGTAAASGDQLLRIGLIGLAAFLAAVMLSTVDSGFMSVAMIVVRDLTGSSLSPAARFVVNSAVVALMAVFAALLVEAQVNILVFLNATYSWGLIFGGLAISHMFGKPIRPDWMVASLIAGAAIGAVSTFNPWHAPDLVALVLPSVAAIGVSCVVVLFAPRAVGRAPQITEAELTP